MVFTYDVAVTLIFYGYNDINLYFWKEILNQKNGCIKSNNEKC